MEVRGDRGQPRLLQRALLSAAALSARRPNGVAQARVQDAVGQVGDGVRHQLRRTTTWPVRALDAFLWFGEAGRLGPSKWARKITGETTDVQHRKDAAMQIRGYTFDFTSRPREARRNKATRASKSSPTRLSAGADHQMGRHGEPSPLQGALLGREVRRGLPQSAKSRPRRRLERRRILAGRIARRDDRHDSIGRQTKRRAHREPLPALRVHPRRLPPAVASRGSGRDEAVKGARTSCKAPKV